MQTVLTAPSPCCCAVEECRNGCILELGIETFTNGGTIEDWTLANDSGSALYVAQQTGEIIGIQCVCGWTGGVEYTFTAQQTAPSGYVVNTAANLSVTITCDGSAVGISGQLEIQQGFEFPLDPSAPPIPYPGLTRDFEIISPLPQFLDEQLACCPSVDESGFGFSNLDLPFTTSTANSIVTDPNDPTQPPPQLNDLPEIEITIYDIGWDCSGATGTTTTTTPPTGTTPTTGTPPPPYTFPLRDGTLCRE